jgi:RNA polymerase sigma factor (sigma-70 family)
MNRVLSRFYDQFTDTDSPTDRQLLDRFLTARDEAAFADLVRRYGSLVWATCRRQLANHQDAEDAFQATFLVLVRRAGQLTDDAPIGPWLYRVAVLTARRVTRGNLRRAPVTGPMEYELPAPEPKPAVEQLDLDAALLELPERDRAMVVLCHLQGLTRREAAQRLGCPEGTLSVRLHRALSRLRARLGALAPVALTAAAVAVPAPLLAATVRTATIYSTSTLAAAGVSPVVVELTDGVLRMFWMKKMMTAAVAAVLALGAGALVLVPAGRSETAARASESGAGSAPAPQDEPVALKRLEQRVADLERHKALLDAAREDQKVAAQKPAEAREEKKAPKEPTPEELDTAINSLKQLGIAHHNYYDEAGKWADDLTDKDARPLLSWRVALLPYLDQKQLYEEFKLDEPWDSEHNKKLIKKMPKVYAPVRVKAKEGETFCQRFVGKGALFNERGAAYLLPELPDGTANTALLVEAGDPVIWTQPADLPFNLKGPLPGLGGLFDGDFHILLCDGSVWRFKKDYDVDEMKKVIRPDDGKPEFEKLKK